MSVSNSFLSQGKQDFYLVETTLGNENDAMSLAKSIIAKSLAACVRIVEAKCCFRWEGSICIEPEYILTAKTSSKKLNQLINHISANHPYDLPEIISIPFYPSKSYGDWVNSETI